MTVIRNLGMLIEAAGGWCILSLALVFVFFLGAYGTWVVDHNTDNYTHECGGVYVP